MDETNVRLNSVRAWLLAARPKTLSGAAVPVAIGIAAAWQYCDGRIKVVPALLCVAFAMLMQVASNFVNDYFDFVRGRDGAERLGPKRACAEGWVTLSAMRWAIAMVMGVACCVGLPLVLYGGWQLVWVGVACVAFCILYTTHLASRGLGDVLVLLFFGLVPVSLTMALSSGIENLFSAEMLPTWLQALACGLLIDTLLMVNNYRDIDGDRASGKRTLVVILGEKWSLRIYLWLGIAACIVADCALFIVGGRWQLAIPMLYLLLHWQTWRLMHRLKGRELNRALALTSRDMLVYGLSVVAALLFV